VDPSPVVTDRRHLINLAYRLLGSLAEAEDAVQDTYARWYAMTPDQQEAIRSPSAWLTTVASRICLDMLGSARSRRERYVGDWLPEPLPGSGVWVKESDPAERITLDESVGTAFLVVLESMTPAERVAFVLREVFCYSFAEVADIVGRSPAACRQLASSARRRVRDRLASPASAAQQAGIVRDFKQAWEANDIAALIGLLDPSATAIADGGGQVSTVAGPIVGADKIARYALAITAFVPDMMLAERAVNGQPGLVALQRGVPVTVIGFGIADGRITHLWGVRNPDKLRLWIAR
jgi:RNA polymerase sigma factor (sigma-70 family)